MKKMFLTALVLSVFPVIGSARQFWNIDHDRNSIVWSVGQDDVHSDHVEMAGRQIAAVVRYGVNPDKTLSLNKSLVWPMLRTVPNHTHASLMRRYDWSPLNATTVNGRSVKQHVDTIVFDGVLTIVSTVAAGRDMRLKLTQTCFPSVTEPSLVETFRFVNTGNKDVTIEFPEMHDVATTNSDKGVYGGYKIVMETYGGGSVTLKPGEEAAFSSSISAFRASTDRPKPIDAAAELSDRRKSVAQRSSSLVLETPDSVINKMFDFAKLRACESIFATKGGPMHGPGGESYYAAIWANDQAEYVNPFFPFTGYDYANESALNSFRHFARYMNDRWDPIPSSIIAEGDSYWNGAGDRGDAAMIGYGAARYLLARNDIEETRELWPLIVWCLEYNRRKLNSDGTVNSNSDELEGRFPSGEANLCTSSLYYDALISASYIADELKQHKTARSYRKQAERLRKDIDRYFASEVEGFDTYAYYKGNDVLRAWICIPLTAGITERAEGTLAALFSPRLWTENGLLTQAGDSTFWDRSTLYALRGAFIAGETEKAIDFVRKYSRTRLLGEHVPYAVEAWPEGGQRHLSAESGLYGRIFTEGMFGIRPTGFRSFSVTPRLPRDWNSMALRKIRAFGGDFDIEVRRVNDNKMRVLITDSGKTVLDREIRIGSTVSCKL